ncbi:MAG: response regulator transcription factor [Candidatus Omnitrophota bacterium]|nr:response regulator transcription factor [Candidatus Omnitrophota bacterium]
MVKQKILVIDDEQDLVELLKFNLQKEGYEVAVAYDGFSGLERARRMPDAIILDLMLPEMNGLDVCRHLKRVSATAGIPILMLTAKGEEADKVVGLELGADDYLAKPFSMRELLARLKAILRRTAFRAGAEEVLIVGSLSLDKGKYEVKLKNKILLLTGFEFRLLWFLAENKGRVLSRRQILREISPDRVTIDRTVDVHVRELRVKLDEAGDLIETIRGVGYRLKVD